jgi:putative iron-dependent peroxidase
MHTQPGILAGPVKQARYLTFSSIVGVDAQAALTALALHIDVNNTVIGLGSTFIKSLGAQVPGMKSMQAETQRGIEIPATPADVWCWLRGSDRGELFHRSRKIVNALVPYFELTSTVDSFQYDQNRDLTGYIDGTENPPDDEAEGVATLQDKGDGLDGSSFVAVQQWVHDFDVIDSMSRSKLDDSIGRRMSDNVEFPESPPSAHVRRSGAKSVDPHAFMLRRSMPWTQEMSGGLMFVAFVNALEAFEAILKRMTGDGDAIQDALFAYTQPVTGAYYWCPPVSDGKLNLTVLESRAR